MPCKDSLQRLRAAGPGETAVKNYQHLRLLIVGGHIAMCVLAQYETKELPRLQRRVAQPIRPCLGGEKIIGAPFGL